MPERIQLRRAKGWRLPPDTEIVDRRTKWGNPFLVSDVARRFPSLTVEQCAATAVADFRSMVLAGSPAYPTVAEIRSELAGRDLACWCPPDQPCHAAVLLELANTPEESA